MTPSTSDRIRALVLQFPGLHLREIARQLDIGLALVQYHLPHLVESGAVQVQDVDGTQRLFAAKHPLDREALASLRDPGRLQICLALLERGTQRHTDLQKITGLGKSTLSFHLKRLERGGLVIRDNQAYGLANPDDLREMMNKFPPTPDAVDKFAKLWGDLYG
jgi:predicted transcriptional regulator